MYKITSSKTEGWIGLGLKIRISSEKRKEELLYLGELLYFEYIVFWSTFVSRIALLYKIKQLYINIQYMIYNTYICEIMLKDIFYFQW